MFILKIGNMINVSSYTFNPLTTRSCIDIPSKEDYCNSQYCSVSTRLHFEFKKCSECNGIVYFVTFTFNDNGVFRFDGRNYLDNHLIRQFCNKSIFPRYLKNNGYDFKFAFFGELGDGKGIRGYENNPHYHALFFLYPLDGCTNLYHNERSFLELCHNAWNQDSSSFGKSYVSLNRGNVSYSKDGATVFDSKVFAYCSSYCIKSLTSEYNKRCQVFFERVAFFTLLDVLFPIPSDSFYRSFVYPYDKTQSNFQRFAYNSFKDLSLTSSYNLKYDDIISILKDSVSHLICEFYSLIDIPSFNFYGIDLLNSPLYGYLMSQPLFSRFYKFLYNNHRVGYRLSVNLGINGLDYVDDKFMLDVSMFHSFTSPRINLPNYYFRRLCFDCIKSNDKYLYVHNESFNKYCQLRYTFHRWRMQLFTFKYNRKSFASSLDDSLCNDLLHIPDDVFVSYKAFRGLCFDVNDLPIIDSSDPWRYLRSLSFVPSFVYSVPMGLQSFKNDSYLSFSLHPYFINYPSLDRLSRLYDDFINSYISSQKVNSTKQYFNLKSNFIQSYEYFKSS